MKSTGTYLNSPVKNCRTCVHCVRDRLGASYDHCNLFQYYCSIAVHHDLCGYDLKAWRAIPPKPPRRSFRQWLYDLLLK